ncbi:MAG: porin [Rhodospirillaceae bacterium]|nr:porin [Rhodospirillaceae bacterium]
MTNFRIMLLSTAAIGLTAVAVTPASAGEVEKSMSMSGHVARSVGIVDNGDTAMFISDDSTRSQSRFKIGASAASEELTVGANVDLRLDGGGNNTGAAPTAESITLNYSNVTLSNNMGTLRIGVSDGAGDEYGVHGSSLSGANGLGMSSSSGAEAKGGFIVKGSGAAGGAEDPTALATTDGNAGFSTGWGNVVRYESPDFNGFSAMVSLTGGATGGGGELVSGNIGYSADYDGVAVAAHLSGGNSSGSSATQDNIWDAGLGIELANGLNFMGAYAEKNLTGTTTQDPEMWMAQVGYDASVFDAGGTAVNITYVNQSDAVVDTSDYTAVGINLTQSLSDYGTDIYAGISQQTYDTSTANYEDITAGWVGVKVSF